MTTTSGLYRVFGLDVQAEIALPELAAAPDAAALDRTTDVTIRIGDAPRPPGAVAIAEGVAADAGRFWMDVPDVARIVVRSGREIVVDPVPGADALVIRAFLLGSALGALLHQRGLLPLHASAVRMGGGAVAFLGASGAGKSTIALHLADRGVGRGHATLSDDICALEIVDGATLLHPGPRRMKLWPGSLAATGRDPVGLAPVLPMLDKYQLPLAGDDAGSAVPLAAVFLLDCGPGTGIEPLPLPAATAALVANTFRGELVAPMGRGRTHFDQCLAIARAPGVQRLRREWSLDRLNAASAAVERWIASHVPPL